MARKVKKNNYKAIAIILGMLLVVSCSIQVVKADGVKSSASELVDIIKAGNGNEAIILGAFEVLKQGAFALGAAPSDIASGLYDVWVENDLTVDGDFVSGGTFTASGTFNSTGDFNYLENVVSSSATTTLTTAYSGETLYISGGQQTYTLPATSTSAGMVVRFVVNGALTNTSTIVTAGGGNDIEGTLIVAGAVVDCDAEDTITFGASFENLGDYIELRTDGVKWFIGDSGALTSGGLACSAT